jgi:hypothetical protein
MKKRILIAISLLASASPTFAQPKAGEVITHEKEFGRNLVDNSAIHGIEFEFADRIHDTYLDTTSNTITIQLRGIKNNGKYLENKGEVIFYDLNAKKVKWRKSINYTQSTIEQLNSLIIETKAGKSNSLNIENGNEEWEIRNSIYYIDHQNEMGLGYQAPGAMKSFSHTLKGFALSTGDDIWTREIDRSYGWNQNFHLDDTTLVVVSSGIHTVNLKTGKGWDYNTRTGEDDYKGAIAANVAGVALGVLTGTFVTSSGHKVIRNVVSNIAMDSANFYLASRESVACIEIKTGRVVWTQALPKDFVSKMNLFLQGRVLHLIGRGYAHVGNKQVSYGQPFIAAFDRQTGAQKYLSPVASKEVILAFQYNRSEVTFIFKNSMMKYSLADGTLVTMEAFKPEEVGDLRHFVGRQVYITKDSLFKSLPRTDTTKQFVFTTTNKTLILNDQLKREGQIDFEELFIHYESCEDLALLIKNKKTIAVNGNLKRVAEIDASSRAFVVDKSLYDVKENTIRRIDLGPLLDASKRE